MSVETEIRSTATLRRSQKAKGMYRVPSWGTLCMLLGRSWPFIWCIRASTFAASERQIIRDTRSLQCNRIKFHRLLINTDPHFGDSQSVNWSPMIHGKTLNRSYRKLIRSAHWTWALMITAGYGLLMICNFGHSKQWNICVACLNHVGIQEWWHIICRLGQYCWPKLKKSNIWDIVDL